MKAILVLEMPECCTDCPCAGNNYGYNECEPKGKRLVLEDIYEKRPSWCPLRPVPEKRQTTDDFWQGCVNIVRNACIDEILGDKE